MCRSIWTDLYLYIYAYVSIYVDMCMYRCIYKIYILCVWYILCYMCMDISAFMPVCVCYTHTYVCVTKGVCMGTMKAESSSRITPRECLCGKQGCRCQSHRKSLVGSCTWAGPEAPRVPAPLCLSQGDGEVKLFMLCWKLLSVCPSSRWARGSTGARCWQSLAWRIWEEFEIWTVWSAPSVNVCMLLGFHLSQCGTFHLWIKLLFRYCALRQLANLPRAIGPLHRRYTFMYILSCVMNNVITFYIQEYSNLSLYILLSSCSILELVSRLFKWHFFRLKWMSCLFKRILSWANCIFFH